LKWLRFDQYDVLMLPTDITKLIGVDEEMIYIPVVILALVVVLAVLLKRKLRRKINEKLEEIDQKLDEVVNSNEEQDIDITETPSVEEDHSEDEETEEFNDDLIKTIAKEAKIEQEEEIDLLRDLKDKEINVEELEKELEGIIEKLRKLK